MSEKHTDRSQEKERFYKALNDFVVSSGVLAAGIKAVTNGIASQVREAKREAEKQALFGGFAAIGIVFAFIGAVQLVTHYLDLSLYTNLIIGGFFILLALIVRFSQK